MSRGFVKEEDQEEIPIVPPRAYLPEGVANFVTPNGLKQLLAEREKLVSEKSNPGNTTENEKRITLNYINARLQLLENRISEAKVVNLQEQPHNEIRFGATVTLRPATSATEQTYQIVGVDEADVSKRKVSFISPFAKQLINKRTGDKVVLKQAGKDVDFIISKISYQP